MMFDKRYVHDLRPLTTPHRLNHTQLWQGCYTDGQVSTLPIVIKQLMPDFSKVHYQWLEYEAKRLAACQSLALKADSDSPFGVSELIATSFIDSGIIKPDQGLPFIVTRYYAGQTLASLIAQPKLALAQTLTQKIDIAIQLCRLIQRFHGLGYIHADIKPSNFLLTHDGHIVLLDMGLARGDNEPLDCTVTAGTPAYMSPEQWTGQPLTTQSDYYSLGITLYEWFSGTKPFNASTLRAYALAHCQAPMPAFQLRLDTVDATMIPTFSAQLHTIFQRLLAKLPHNRVSQLDEVINALNALAVDSYHSLKRPL